MTEKIARRGVKTPHAYESDILERITVGQVMNKVDVVLQEDNTIQEAMEILTKSHHYPDPYFVVASKKGEFRGILSSAVLFSDLQSPMNPLRTITKATGVSIGMDQSLRTAAERMATEKTYALAVLSPNDNGLSGMISYKDIIDTIQVRMEDHGKKYKSISLKRHALKMLIRGQKLVNRKGRE